MDAVLTGLPLQTECSMSFLGRLLPDHFNDDQPGRPKFWRPILEGRLEATTGISVMVDVDETATEQ